VRTGIERGIVDHVGLEDARRALAYLEEAPEKAGR
jgi:hypothetical protein